MEVSHQSYINLTFKPRLASDQLLEFYMMLNKTRGLYYGWFGVPFTLIGQQTKEFFLNDSGPSKTLIFAFELDLF